MPQNPYLIDEKNIPENWEPIDVPATIPGRAPGGAPAPPVPHDMPQYFSGSIAPVLQHDSSFVATEMASPRIPKTALMPFGNQANPFTNAAATSTAKIIAQQVVAATPPAVGSSGPDSDIITAVKAGVFGSVDVSSFTGGSTTFGIPATASNTVTPSTAGEVILSYRMMSNSNPPVFTAPWTVINLNAGAIGKLGWQKVTPTTAVTDSFSINSNQGWVMGMLALQSSGTPVVTVISTNVAPLPTTATGVNIVGGVGLFVFIEFAANSQFSPGASVTDSLGNVYVLVGDKFALNPTGTAQSELTVFYCANPTGGAGVTINFNGNSAATSTAYAVIQITNLAVNAATSTFAASDANKLVQFRGSANVVATLPNPTLAAGWQAVASNNGTGSITIIPAAGSLLNQGAGGVVLPMGAFLWIFSDGSNYWSTGAITLPTSISPALHKFLTSYNPFSGGFTSAQPAFSDLSGTIANSQIISLPKITNYNNIATVSNGIPSEVATVDAVAQSAAIATTTLYSVPASGVGQYRLSWDVDIRQPATTSSTLGPLTISWTNPDATVQTITVAAQNNAGTMVTSDSGNLQTTQLVGNSILLNIRQSTLITYAFAYASAGATAMQYNLHIKLEAM